MSLLHWVWLSLAVLPGSPLGAQILSRYPDPEEFFLGGEAAMDEIPGLSDQSRRLRLRATTLEMAKDALAHAERVGAVALPQNDPRFPKRLLSIPNPPVLLYVLGDVDCLGEGPAVAVVGTRQMSDYGRRMANVIAGGLAAAGTTVVSGMAAGIDSAGHIACMENGGKTIAVQGCGICNVYPAENAYLKEMILHNGAVISEFAPDAEPQSSFFLIRNRLVSGLSLGVCVIEAAARSGTSVTAKLAIEQGRDVFAVPADLTRPTAQGTLHLLQKGAIPVSSATDILTRYKAAFPELDLTKIREMNEFFATEEPTPTPKPKPSKATKKPAPAGLSPMAAALYAVIDDEPRAVDELSEKAGLSASQAAAALTELEIYSLVKAVPGRRFTIG